MGFLKNLFNKEETPELPHFEDGDIVSVCSGTIIPASQIKDDVFAQEMMGQTIGFIPNDGTFVSPANGTLEVMYPTGHAYAIRMKDNTGLLVHIGINTVNMKGKGFKVLKKQGDSVKAGEPLVKVDLKAVKDAGYDNTTMLIVTEGEKVNYTDQTQVSVATKIN